MPLAARITDAHACPIPGHGAPPIASGSFDVIVGNMPAARVGDILACAPPDIIVQGDPTVLINYRPAARISDPTAHGGKIIAGCPTVIFGESGQSFTLKAAAASGAPFCEECEKAKRELERQQKAAEAKPPVGSTILLSNKASADPPVVTLKGVSPDAVALAKSDGSSPAQVKARKAVAVAFYAQHGVKYNRQTKLPATLSGAEIRSHIKGIDFTKPLSFGPPPKLPEDLHQWQMPGWDQGQYYAGPDANPTDLGIHHSGSASDGSVVLKLKSPFTMHAHGPYLTSTAGAIDDTWSIKGQAHPTKGGAIQFYVPNREHATLKG